MYSYFNFAHFLILLLVIIVLPSINSFPVPIGGSLEETNNATRHKRQSLLEDIVDFGRSISQDNVGVAKVKAHFLGKDAERMCRRIRGPVDPNDLLCVEGLGSSILLGTLSSAVKILGSGNTPNRRPPTSPPSLDNTLATVNIDIIQVFPTEKPGNDEDMPPYMHKLLKLIKTGVHEYGAEIKKEVNILADRISESDTIRAIKNQSESTGKIAAGVETISSDIREVVKSINDTNETIGNGTKGIETSIDSGSRVIQQSVESGATLIEASIDKGTTSIEKSVEGAAKTIQSGLVNSTQGLQSSMHDNALLIRQGIDEHAVAGKDYIEKGLNALTSSVKAGSRSIALSVEKVPIGISESINEHAETVDKTIHDFSSDIQRSMRFNADVIQKSIDKSSQQIADVLDTQGKGITQNIGADLKSIEKAIVTGSENVNKTMATGITSLNDSLRIGFRDNALAINRSTDAMNSYNGTLYTIKTAISDISIQLGKIIDVLAGLLPKSGKQRLVLQSQILETIQKLFENIRNDKPSNMGDVLKDLTDEISKLSRQLPTTGMVKQTVKTISIHLGSIDANDNNAMEKLGKEIEGLGRILHEERKMLPGIMTGKLFISIGSIIQTVSKSKSLKNLKQ